MFKSIPWLLALLLAGETATAGDLARETRIKEQIIDAVFDGEPLTLEAQGHEFLAIHMETDAEAPRGAALILHGRGLHPNWPNVVHPLRTGLAEAGWSTLSIQLPVLPKQVKYFDYVPIFHEAHPRIEAAIQFLREQGHRRIVLIAHSCGAHMAMDWVHFIGDSSIDAYVGIGMGATDYKQPMARPFPFERMRVPILDVYGSADYPAVLRMAPARREAIRAAGNPQSQQHVVEGADHYFENHNGALVDVVREWLNGLRF